MKKAIILLAILSTLCLPSVSRADLEWRARGDGEDQQYLLFNGNVQLGAYVVKEGKYYMLTTTQFGDQWMQRDIPEDAPPIPLGVDMSKIRDGEHYTVNGKESSRRDAMDAIKGSGGSKRPTKRSVQDDKKIPDDRWKWRVTPIGTPAETDQVVKDFATSPLLEPWRNKVVVVPYEPSDFEVSRQGFYTGGHPTIYIQAPSSMVTIDEKFLKLASEGKPVYGNSIFGVVLHRQDDYIGGAQALADVMRRIDPDYTPNADRDLRSRIIPDVPVTIPAVIGAGVIVILYLRTRRR